MYRLRNCLQNNIILSTKYLTVCLFRLAPISSEMLSYDGEIFHAVTFRYRTHQNICWVLCLKGSSLPKNDITCMSVNSFTAVTGWSAG